MVCRGDARFVRFGSSAALLINISLMSAIEGKADIESVAGGHKKPGTWPGLQFAW